MLKALLDTTKYSLKVDLASGTSMLMCEDQTLWIKTADMQK